MNRLVRFHAYCGRSGSLEGLFVATDVDWARLLDLQESKTEIYFGEVLGKHSEVKFALEEKDYEVFSEDQDLIKALLDRNKGRKTIVGTNPLDYVDLHDEEYDDATSH